MSEYWKSTPKYWCKHCSTYVKDTPFERKQHENTGKHQGNLKRFLRGIQNDHEKNEREKDRAKAEIDRLNRVVGGQTNAAGPSSLNPRTNRTSAVTAPKAAPTAVDQKRQWSQLAEMGIQVPEDFRAQMAMPGQWQSTVPNAAGQPVSDDSLNVGVRKRKLESHEEEQEEEGGDGGGGTLKRKGWGTATRSYPGQDDADLDALLHGSLLKETIAPTEAKSEPDNFAKVKSEPHQPFDKTDVNNLHIKVETKDRADLDDMDSAADPKPIKSEDAGLHDYAASNDVATGDAAPVFKKRKTKSKIAKATD